MLVKGYILLNEDKVTRALEGTLTQDNVKVGGVAKPDGSYDENELLVEYDRLGGGIKKGMDKVKMGSFYDFKTKKAREVPEIVFQYRINGKQIEVAEGEAEPGIVKANRLMEEDKEEKSKKSKKK